MTAFDDQFVTGKAVAPVRETLSREAILRRNIAALEVALKQQTERAEASEAELARMAQQKPVAWCDPVEFKDDPWSFSGFKCRTNNYPTMALYAAPVHAPHKGATHCDDCGLTWLDDGLNPLGCPYCKNHASERNARRYLALREYGVKVDIKGRWLNECYLDAAADRLLENK